MQRKPFGAFAAVALLCTGTLTADPVQPLPHNDYGQVFWYRPPDRRAVEPHTKPIRDDVPRGGKLEFGWTLNNEPHPDFGVYKFPPDGQTTNGGVRYFYQPRAVDPERPITDWTQTVTDRGGTSTVRAGNIQHNSPWQFHPLADLGPIDFRIPDLAPMNAADPETTIYTAVNLGLYHASNPFGFLHGHYRIGQTLDDLGLEIRDGKMAGLEGIYWSLTPFDFDPASDTGWVPSGGPGNWLNYGGIHALSTALSSPGPGYSVGINGIHQTVPEPSSFVLAGIGGVLVAIRVRRRLWT